MNNHLLKTSYLILALSLSINSYGMNGALKDLFTNGKAKQVGEGVAEVVGGMTKAAAQIARDLIERDQKDLEKWQNLLKKCPDNAQDDYLIRDGYYDTYQKKYVVEKLTAAQRKLDKTQARADKLEDTAQNVGLGLFNAVGDAGSSYIRSIEENRKADLIRKQETEVAAVKSHLEGQTKKAINEQWINFLSDRKKVMQISLAIGAAALGIYGAREGTKVLAHYIEIMLGKPKLIRESSVDSYWQRAKDKVFGKKPVVNNLEDVITHEATSKKLQTLATVTKNAKALNEPLMNALFYGPPGVGKTMYAKELAKFSDMEYAVMSGADFSQFKEGDDIMELHKLFDWAAQSTKGLIVFIDEADSFLRKRTPENKKATNLTNAFLSRVEKQTSNNIIFVFATNHPEVLDSAILSRIAPGNRIEFCLPGAQERNQIFDLYLKKYTTARDITVDQTVTERKQQLAVSMEGLSGRDIDGMVVQMARNARLTGTNVITLGIAQEVINTTLEEKKKETFSYKQ